MLFIFHFNQLQQAKEKIEQLEKEQSAFLEIIVQEKAEREQEEERLRKSLTVGIYHKPLSASSLVHSLRNLFFPGCRMLLTRSASCLRR